LQNIFKDLSVGRTKDTQGFDIYSLLEGNMSSLHFFDDMKSSGWVIAASCSWINFFLFSIFRSAGVLYLALITTEDLKCSYEEASWPITLASGVGAISCLPAGFLNHYLPVKPIVMTGICITSFSISICYFATSLSFITFFLGTIQGN
jgi:hypothetical protein